jgi:5-formyltetrahydrofolate cyclo-ligase
MGKAALRKRIKAKQLTTEEKQVASHLVTQHLLQYVDAHLPDLRKIGVAIFRSFSDEVQLQEFEKALVQREIPIWHPDLGPLHEAALIIVPGLAFDRQGNRLGRGGGYYDRLLFAERQKSPSAIAVGVGFDHQLIDEVPHEQHDQRVDLLCMPSHGLFQSH